MGLGNNVLFAESFKSRIYLSPLYTRKNTLRENSLGISSTITTRGVYGKHISWEHSLAIGPFFCPLFTGGQYWGETENALYT